MRSGVGGREGACLTAPLGEPRVPRGGGAGQAAEQPRFSRGRLLRTGEKTSEIRLASRSTSLKMPGQGVSESRAHRTPKAGLGCNQSPTWGSVPGPTRQGKGCPVSSVPFHPSSLPHSSKLLVPTHYLPAANLKTSLGFRACKMVSSGPPLRRLLLGEMRVSSSLCAAHGGADRVAEHNALRSHTLSSSRPPAALGTLSPPKAGSQPGLQTYGNGGTAGRGSETRGRLSPSR